jgi:hypothetical protein
MSLNSTCVLERPSSRSAISEAAFTAPGPSEQAISIRFSATTSAYVRPAGSPGLISANRVRRASESSRDLGLPPGFPLVPFFHCVPLPILGSNAKNPPAHSEQCSHNFEPFRIDLFVAIPITSSGDFPAVTEGLTSVELAGGGGRSHVCAVRTGLRTLCVYNCVLLVRVIGDCHVPGVREIVDRQ